MFAPAAGREGRQTNDAFTRELARFGRVKAIDERAQPGESKADASLKYAALCSATVKFDFDG